MQGHVVALQTRTWVVEIKSRRNDILENQHYNTAVADQLTSFTASIENMASTAPAAPKR